MNHHSLPSSTNNADVEIPDGAVPVLSYNSYDSGDGIPKAADVVALLESRGILVESKAMNVHLSLLQRCISNSMDS